LIDAAPREEGDVSSVSRVVGAVVIPDDVVLPTADSMAAGNSSSSNDDNSNNKTSPNKRPAAPVRTAAAIGASGWHGSFHVDVELSSALEMRADANSTSAGTTNGTPLTISLYFLDYQRWHVRLVVKVSGSVCIHRKGVVHDRYE
jgi:hypothetical protein